MLRHALPVTKKLVPEWHYCYYNSKKLQALVEVLEKLSTIHLILRSKTISYGNLRDAQVTEGEAERDLLIIMQQIKMCNKHIYVFRDVELQVIFLFANTKACQLHEKFKFYRDITKPMPIDDGETLILIENVYIELGFLLKLIENTCRRDEVVMTNQKFVAGKLEQIQAPMTNRGINRIYKFVKREFDTVYRYYLEKKSLNPTKMEKVEFRQLPNYELRVSEINYCKFGLLCGLMAFCLGSLLMLIDVSKIDIRHSPLFATTFPAWRAISYLIFYMWVLGLNLLVFEHKQINYKRIMHLGSISISDSTNVLKFAAFASIIYLTFFILYTLSNAGLLYSSYFLAEYYIAIVWMIVFFILFLPIPISSTNSIIMGRNFAQVLVLKMLVSWIIGVDYSANWLSEQLTSFKLPFQDISYTLMLFTRGDNPVLTSDSLYIGAIIGSTMFGIRILQAISRGIRQRAYWCQKPYFRGTLKCTFNIITIWVSYYYRIAEQSNDQNLITTMRAAWIVSAIISTSYAYTFDLFLDWNYLTLRKGHFLPDVRKNIIYPKWVYTTVIVINLFLRITWILTFSTDFTKSLFADQSNFVFFTLIIAYLEIIRRGLWNLLVFEKDHIKNCLEFQANVDATAIENKVIKKYNRSMHPATCDQLVAKYRQHALRIGDQKENLRNKIAATQVNDQRAASYITEIEKDIILEYEKKYNLKMNAL